MMQSDESEPLVERTVQQVDNDLNFTIDESADNNNNYNSSDDYNRHVEEVHYELQSNDVARPEPKGGPVEQWESDLKSERRQVGGAAAAGAIAGLVVGGPLVALMVAGGAAVVATTRGKAGDVTRHTGEVFAQAGDRLKKLDEKHHVSENASKRFAKSAKWIQERLKPQHEREENTAFDLTN